MKSCDVCKERVCECTHWFHFCGTVEQREGFELLQRELVTLLRQRAEQERDEAISCGKLMRRVHVYAAQRLTILIDELLCAEIKTDWDEEEAKRRLLGKDEEGEQRRAAKPRAN